MDRVAPDRQGHPPAFRAFRDPGRTPGRVRPRLYDGWTAEAVTLAAKAAGLTPKTVKVRGRGTTGITWAELDAAQERRAQAKADLDDQADTNAEDLVNDDVDDDVSAPRLDDDPEAGELVAD